MESFDKKKFIDLISDLYDKNKSVKEYLDYYVNPDENETLKSYKSKVRDPVTTINVLVI